MRYLSVCSGIEAATVAWHPLGWTPVAFAEIEPFPCAVLKHHYPQVLNLGDLTKFQEWPDLGPIDLIVGGTPCQSFSVAGLRAGLADPRGNLALTFLAVVDRYRPRWVVWENVPGVFSSTSHHAPDPCLPPDHLEEGAEWVGEDEYDADEVHAFACLLAGFSELGYLGSYGTLDAQYRGLAQRRKRVFALGHSRDWRRASAAFFDLYSLSGHPAPRRAAGESAPTLPSRSTAGGGLGTDFDCDGGLVARSLRGQSQSAHDKTLETYVPEIVPQAISSKWSKGSSGPAGDEIANLIATPFTLASRGRGDTHELEYRQDGLANAILTPNGGRAGIGVGAVAFKPAHFTRDRHGAPSEITPPLSAEADRGDQDTVIAFSAKDHGADAGEISPTLRAGGHNTSHANGGVMPAVAYALGSHAGTADGDQSNRSHAKGGPVGMGISEECAHTLRSGRSQPVARGFADVADPVAANQARTYTCEGSNNFRVSNVAHTAMQVRRLTPRECERLQGFPDDYTKIPMRRTRKAPSDKRLAKYHDLYELTADGWWIHYAQDGPRYKALGNSMAATVMRWLGQRIAMVEAIS
jgi:DNA (cytosine-5)-methyltransferase 1